VNKPNPTRLFLSIDSIPCQWPQVRRHVYSQNRFQAPADIGEIEPDGRIGKDDHVKLAASVAARTKKAIADLAAQRDKLAAAAETVWRAYAADGWFGHIAAIGFAIDDGPVRGRAPIDAFPDSIMLSEFEDGSPCADVAGETLGLLKFFETVEVHYKPPFVICGHDPKRIANYLRQRCIVGGIKTPFWIEQAVRDCRRSGGYTDDIGLIAGSTLPDNPRMPSLNHLCRALDIEQMPSFDPWETAVAGDLGAITRHAMTTVQRVRSVWRRLHAQDMLSHDRVRIVSPLDPEVVVPRREMHPRSWDPFADPAEEAKRA
jgi:hypothetical protein